VVNVNTFCASAKRRFKIKPANGTQWAVVLDTHCASTRVSLVGIYCNAAHGTFPKPLFCYNLIATSKSLQTEAFEVCRPNRLQLGRCFRGY